MAELLVPTSWPELGDGAMRSAPTAQPPRPGGSAVRSAVWSPAVSRPRGRVATAALTGAICLAPLPFASNAPVPVALLALLLALGLACAPQPRKAEQRRLLFALALLACTIIGVVAVQLSPGTPADPVWTDAAWLLGLPVAASRAVVRGAPLFAIGNLELCLASMALGLLVGGDRGTARRMVDAAAWSALIYAALGIANAIFDPEGLLWRERENYVGAVLGPFVNRNTAAIYFGCGASLWVARLGALMAQHAWRSSATLWPWRRLAAPGLAAGICLGAVVATGSRSGTLLSLCGVLSVMLISVRKRLSRSPPRVRLVALALPSILALLTLLSGTAGLRLHSLGFADEGRFAVYRAVLPIIAAHPWLGTGLGTFAAIYPSYRSSIPGMRNIWDKAHSTPLELASEAGLPLALLICAGAIGVLALLLRGALTRQRDADLPLAAGACFGLAAAHSCLDFSLQIPGLAVVVTGLAGLGLAQAFRSGDRTTRHAAVPSAFDSSAATSDSGPT